MTNRTVVIAIFACLMAGLIISSGLFLGKLIKYETEKEGRVSGCYEKLAVEYCKVIGGEYYDLTVLPPHGFRCLFNREVTNPKLFTEQEKTICHKEAGEK